MATSVKKVAFVLPELGGGGAERTFLNLVNHLDRATIAPLLVLYRRSGEYLPLVESDVEIMEIGCRRARHSIEPLRRLIGRVRPDLVVSTLQYVNVATVIACRLAKGGARVAVRESNHQSAAGWKAMAPRSLGVRWAYNTADGVIALSEGVRQDLRRRLGLSSDQVTTIYNPIDIREIEAQAASAAPSIEGWTDAVGRLKIVTMGRLVPQKGFDLLIRAVSSLSIPWTLLIIGTGSQRERLAAVAREAGVEDRVHWAGFVERPFPYIRSADLFVLSSRWEGFGHVIAEAMVCGTPVLATRCPSGPDEIISDGVDGILCDVGSESALTRGIESLGTDQDMRRRLASVAEESVRRFDVRTIARRYESLFDRIWGG